jgi:phosphomannomutase/phosphoglucomutase
MAELKVPQTIFRANDIRGNVSKELTPDVVRAIGLGLGSLAQENKVTKLIVARDGRLSSPILAEALMQGLIQTGCDLIDIGAVPSPLLYFATQALGVLSGVMVTGSHNPADDNGLKIVLNGSMLSEEQIQSIFKKIEAQSFKQGKGKRQTADIIPLYESKLAGDIKLKRKIRIVADAGNGIVGTVFPHLARKLGAEVVELFSEVDGHFPNHFPDPALPKNLADLIKKVQECGAAAGVAFDSDGDRLGLVTNKGTIIESDRLLMLFAMQVLKKDPGAVIIYDVKCTRHLDKWIKDHKGSPLMWKTGHSLIIAKMEETGAKLAGELSGHFYFKDRFFGFDDALYAAARFLEILSEGSQRSEDLFALIPTSVSTPELKIEMADEKKFQFMDQFKKQAVFKGGKMNTLDGVRVDFDYGFGLVRPSNTTPSLVLRFEADTLDKLKAIQEMFRAQLLAIQPGLLMPF